MINLKFLGTGNIDTTRPRNKLSKEYRRFATLLADDCILIDPAEDVFEFENTFMLQGMLRGAKDIFITHSHIDRFSPLAIEKLARGGGVRVYAARALEGEIRSIAGAEYVPLDPFSLIKLASHTVVPLPAIHKTDNPYEIPFNFLIEKDGQTVFYGLDGAWLHPAAWQVLSKITLSCAVLDCALVNEPLSGRCTDHNSLELIKLIYGVMSEGGVVDGKTRIILSNIPNGKKRLYHDELTEAIGDLPFRVAYDGYFVNI